MTVIRRFDGLHREQRELENPLVELSLVCGSRSLVGSPNCFHHQRGTMGSYHIRPSGTTLPARRAAVWSRPARALMAPAAASGLACPAAAVGSRRSGFADAPVCARHAGTGVAQVWAEPSPGGSGRARSWANAMTPGLRRRLPESARDPRSQRLLDAQISRSGAAERLSG